MTEEELFDRALELPVTERTAFLDRECQGEPQLRSRLEALLAADAASRAPFDPPYRGCAAGVATVSHIPSTDEVAGTIVAGRYKLLQRIGEGGMGSVWMAEQTEPIRRTVAVKLIRVDHGQSKMIVARFSAERQAIALMDHPHIARLFDAGTTETGHPFFVMELVKGIPLHDFCEQHRLSVRDRLQLFMKVCGAVQHAHQKGIIHRDLKPSNILVESHDGKPVPKVIDFGLAKTTGMRLTEDTMFTGFGSILGTPAYMAPEQAVFNAVDVDTRADVYALGVLLYELLTGTTPLTRETLKQAALDEIVRLIREHEPPTPSSRLSSSESRPSAAANCQMEPLQLSRYIQGDLDWIVLKALAKDRDRRYETANNLALDIERFLNLEPVSAGPPTAAYRLQKFVKRNRLQVIAASVVLLALVTGAVGTTVGMVQANRARIAESEQRHLADTSARKANEERRKAEAAAHKESLAKEAAQRNLAYSVKANKILGSIFEGLDPENNYGSVGEFSDALRKNLNRAIADLEGSALGDPLVIAEIQNTLGLSVLRLGDAMAAIQLFEKARAALLAVHGSKHQDTMICMGNLASAYAHAGKLDKAIPLYQETLKLQESVFGSDHSVTISNMCNLATAYRYAGELDMALPLYEESLALYKKTLGRDHPDTITAAGNLASCYAALGQWENALPLLEETLTLSKAKLGPTHPDTLVSLGDLGIAYWEGGQPDKALALLEETVRLTEAKLGREHPSTLISKKNLGMMYAGSGRPNTAVPLLEEQLTLAKAKLGPSHLETLLIMSNLGFAYFFSGQLERAQALFEQTLQEGTATLGLEHPVILKVMHNLAVAYKESEHPEKALPLLEETIAHQRDKLGMDHPDTRSTMKSLVEVYQALGRSAEANKLLDELIVEARRNLPAGSLQFASSLAELSTLLLHSQRFADAEFFLHECLRTRQQLEPDTWTTFNTRSMLGESLFGQDKIAEAEPILIEGYEGLKQREETIPKDGGGALRIPQALDRLIGLYQALNRPDEVKKYQELRAAYPAAEDLRKESP